MKNIKKIVAVGAFVFVIGATTITGLAATGFNSPAEVVAKLTGNSVENVIATKTESNKTYGSLAAEAGKLEEFKVAVREMKKEKLNAQVQAGTMTQERADAILAKIEENQVNCDGTGSKQIGQSLGARFGLYGEGQGLGHAHQNQAKGRGRNR